MKLSPRMWGAVRVLLAATLLFAISSSVTLIRPEDKTTAYAFATYTRTWTGDVQTHGVPILWEVKQTAGVTITYRSSTNQPVYATVNWTRCAVSAFWIEVGVSWCGFTRVSDRTHYAGYSLDFGFNFWKKAYMAYDDCWARRTLIFVFSSSNVAPFFEKQRSGC